ncbi:MAG: NosD domain-containing protein, partial [Candidatus Thermoplasmatota archaeon]|nr:NosD domain-containing protein [Candidatus Thermoplasmatota archaeon]
ILINCNYCNVTNLDLSNTTVGVELAYSGFITISKNKLINNKFAGIYIESSYNNIVEKNTIKNNGYGVNIQLANNNKIKNNNFYRNSYGCYLYLSNINTIFFNNVLYNSYGITLKTPCNSNAIYCNNLIGNGYNAWDENEKTNTWFYREKGNYWDDYTKKYPNAKKLYLKSVWDTAYEIPNKENKDEYPLLRPMILSNEKIKNQLLTRFFVKILNLLTNSKQNIIY